MEDDYIFNLDEKTYAGLTAFAREVAIAMKAAIECKRIGVAVLGMEVPHTHIHLVPLQSEADLDFRKEKLSLSPEEMQAIADSIRTACSRRSRTLLLQPSFRPDRRCPERRSRD